MRPGTDHDQAFEEITNWVMSHCKRTRPEALLSALVGNAITLARTLGIPRAGFIDVVNSTWEGAERRAAERTKRGA